MFVLPTITIEGFGLVTAEALASGLPVMGTPVGATEEILKQIDERLLFHNTSPDALAEGLEAFLKAPEIFKAMRPKCRNVAETQYSWGMVVKRIEQEFVKANCLIRAKNIRTLIEKNNFMNLVFPRLILVTVIGLVYANTFLNSFHFDDLPSILEKPWIRGLDKIPQFLFSLFQRPLVILSFNINYAISEFGVWSYHLFNIVSIFSPRCWFIGLCEGSWVFWMIFTSKGFYFSAIFCGNDFCVASAQYTVRHLYFEPLVGNGHDILFRSADIIF